MDLFQGHHSTDLSFIHPPTFSEPLRQASRGGFGSVPVTDGVSAQPPGSDEFLLAFLALTVRLHPKLLEHHATHGRDPIAASEFYAKAASVRLVVPMADDASLCDLEKVQTLLMCARHEWSLCRGVKAWIHLRTAITLIQLLHAGFDDDLDPNVSSLTVPSSEHDYHQYGRVNPTLDETRRRTFWSCFILERHLADGVERPAILPNGESAGEILVQLPASDRAFHFGDSVNTALIDDQDHVRQRLMLTRQARIDLALGRSDDPEIRPMRAAGEWGDLVKAAHRRDTVLEARNDVRWELGQEENPISRYIRLLSIYGRVVEFACSGAIK